MSIQLENKDLINSQQMQVAVNGPDGATHLIICTGMAIFGSINRETYTFEVGPKISRRQFVGAIASGALSIIQASGKAGVHKNAIDLRATLISIEANFDDETGQVKVRAEVSSSQTMIQFSISYNVNILAELPIL